eukprot:281080-Lingulodinium_polyedra.AAC.1
MDVRAFAQACGRGRGRGRGGGGACPVAAGCGGLRPSLSGTDGCPPTPQVTPTISSRATTASSGISSARW